MTKTLREIYIEALIKRGCKTTKQTSRYIVLSQSNNRNNFYIGKSGSLRIGATLASSIPASPKFKAELKEMVK